MKNSRGLALILVAGILTLLAAAGAGMLALAARLREQTGASTDLVSARLLAGSGIAYAEGRLAENPLGVPQADRAAGNQSDDWTCRDDPASSLENGLNPSYAITEPYSDVNGNGRYDAAVDTLPPGSDWNANRRFDAWSGRLRGPDGPGRLFRLKIQGAGGRIDINGGVVGGPGASSLAAQRVDPLYTPNLRLARILNNLQEIVEGTTSPDLGVRIIENRPPGGYRSVEELARFLSPSLYSAAKGFLSASSRRDPGTYYYTHDEGKLFADPRSPVNLGSAPAEVLAALQRELMTHYATEYAKEGATLGLDYDYTAPLPDQITVGTDQEVPPEAQSVFDKVKNLRDKLPVKPPIELTVPEEGKRVYDIELGDRNPHLQSHKNVRVLALMPPDDRRVADFLSQFRPFPSRYELFRLLDERKASLFPQTVQTFLGAGYDPLMVMDQMVNLVAANASPRKPAGWPAGNSRSAAAGPWSWITYDVSRWRWSSGETRLPRSPGAEFQSDTAELELEPDGRMAVESLGIVPGLRGNRASCTARAEVRIMDLLSVRSQAELEGTLPPWGPGWKIGEVPRRDRTACQPSFPLDDLADLKTAPPGFAERFRYSPFAGDLRLMDRSDPQAAAAAELYFPFWERSQPLRPAAPRTAWTAESNLRGVAAGRYQDGSGTARPATIPEALAADLLCADYAGSVLRPGRAAGQGYAWQGASSANAENPGRFPWVSEAGTALQGAIEFWSDGSGCSQWNPAGVWMGLRPTPVLDIPMQIAFTSLKIELSTSPMSVGWQQCDIGTGVVLWDYFDPSVRTQQGEWVHAAFAFDATGPLPGVRGYRDGIQVIAGAYSPQAENPLNAEDLTLGVEFPKQVPPAVRTPGVDEVMVYSSAGALSGPALIGHASRPRYWVPEGGPGPAGVPSYISPLYVRGGAGGLIGVRWDGFVPQKIRDAAPSAGGRPLDVRMRFYSDPQGKTLLADLPLAADGAWTRIGSLERKAASFRFEVRIDAGAVPDGLRDTPVFEGISVGYASRSGTGRRPE